MESRLGFFSPRGTNLHLRRGSFPCRTRDLVSILLIFSRENKRLRWFSALKGRSEGEASRRLDLWARLICCIANIWYLHGVRLPYPGRINRRGARRKGQKSVPLTFRCSSALPACSSHPALSYSRATELSIFLKAWRSFNFCLTVTCFQIFIVDFIPSFDMICYRAPGNILCSLLFIDPYKKTLLNDIFLFLKKELHLLKAQPCPQSDHVLHSHGYRQVRKQHLCH